MRSDSVRAVVSASHRHHGPRLEDLFDNSSPMPMTRLTGRRRDVPVHDTVAPHGIAPVDTGIVRAVPGTLIPGPGLVRCFAWRSSRPPISARTPPSSPSRWRGSSPTRASKRPSAAHCPDTQFGVTARVRLCHLQAWHVGFDGDADDLLAPSAIRAGRRRVGWDSRRAPYCASLRPARSRCGLA